MQPRFCFLYLRKGRYLKKWKQMCPIRVWWNSSVICLKYFDCYDCFEIIILWSVWWCFNQLTYRKFALKKNHANKRVCYSFKDFHEIETFFILFKAICSGKIWQISWLKSFQNECRQFDEIELKTTATLFATLRFFRKKCYCLSLKKCNKKNNDLVFMMKKHFYILRLQYDKPQWKST